MTQAVLVLMQQTGGLLHSSSSIMSPATDLGLMLAGTLYAGAASASEGETTASPAATTVLSQLATAAAHLPHIV